MTYRRIATFGMALLLVLSGLSQSARAAQQVREDVEKRSIVFILVDDMRFDAMSLFGHPFLETPNLDALARSGLIFNNSFVTTSLCSPSRASILTGQYAHRHRVLDNNTRLRPGTPTFPQLLQDAGYDTAFVGKWHMGGGSDEPRPGFDRWVSFRGQGVYHDPTFNIDGESTPRQGYISDLITDYAVEFLEQDREAPFMLYVSHKAVHAMFSPAGRHKGTYAGKKYPYPVTMANTEENYRTKPEWVRAQRQSWHGVDGMYNNSVDFDQFVIDYAETMRGVDESVGRIVAALRERGLLESTLLVFTSDNGFVFGEQGHIDKRTMYEASIRVPLLISCPELFPAGRQREEMILNIDFAPTFIEAAGLEVPDSVQGMSFYGLLDGSRDDWRDAFLYEYFWERNFPQTPTVLGVRTLRYKFMKYHGVWDRYELYDLLEDPDETTNLIAQYAVENHAGAVDSRLRTIEDPDLKAVVNDMQGKLRALLREMGAAQEPNWIPLQSLD